MLFKLTWQNGWLSPLLRQVWCVYTDRAVSALNPGLSAVTYCHASSVPCRLLLSLVTGLQGQWQRSL